MVKFLDCGQGFFCFDVFESSSTSSNEVDPFIKFFEQDYKIAMQQKSRKRTMLLTTLMNRLEDHYKLSMNKARFEKETSPEVQTLYLKVAAGRIM